MTDVYWPLYPHYICGIFHVCLFFLKSGWSNKWLEPDFNMFSEHCYIYHSSPTFQHFSNKHLEFSSSSICITSMHQSRSLWDLLIFFWSLWWKLRALLLGFFIFYFVRQVWKQVSDSNTEWLLNMYIAFIYVGGEWQCSLRVETMAFSLYPWQLAQGRANRWHVRGAQYVFIMCIYSHVHIPWRQGSQTHMLMVTGYWPDVITREWWDPIRELVPYVRSSPSHHMCSVLSDYCIYQKML